MKFVLAPLAGFTNAPFRLLCRRGGADLTVTEMVSAAGLAHGSSPTRQLMETMPGEGPVVCQLFGSRPEELALAAREAAATGRFAAIDLNAGCPMAKVTREGAGAALVRDPGLVHDCVKAMVAAAGGVPVTVKTRPGARPDRVNVLELLAAAEEAGAAGFTLHARFTSQMHGGEARLDLLAETVRRAKIPVTGNGGVVDAASAAKMAATGVAAVMVGRAALAKPWIFRELRGDGPRLDGLEPAPPEPEAVFREHLALSMEFRRTLARRFPQDRIPSPDGWAAAAVRTHLFRYFSGRPGAARLRLQLNSVRTLKEIAALASGDGILPSGGGL